MSWYNEAIFYHIYPLGLTGTPKQNDYTEPVQCITTNFFDMADPWKESVQAMYRFCVLILFGSTGKAKWINVIKNSFVIPTHVSSSRFVVVWGIDIKRLDKSMGLSLNGSPLGFAICYEIIT